MDDGPSQRAHMFVGNSSLRIDEEGFGDSPDAVVDGNPSRWVPAIRVGYAELFDKILGILFRVLDVDPEKDRVLFLRDPP